MNATSLYNSEIIFNNIFPQEIKLFSATQLNHAGRVSVEKIESIRSRLFEKSMPGITFNKSKIKEIITEGNCSAIALEFAFTYINSRKDLSKKIAKINLIPLIKAMALIILIKNLGKNFHASNEEMRIRQAAYDTIEVLPTVNNIDCNKGKIQSIANYHNFKIDITTDEINSELISQPSDIQEYVCSLPKGVYLLRIIKPAENEKRETCGHSTIYIQEGLVKVFFDPNRGAYDISKGDVAEKFFTIFQSQLFQFNLTQVRFYRLFNKAFL